MDYSNVRRAMTVAATAVVAGVLVVGCEPGGGNGSGTGAASPVIPTAKATPHTAEPTAKAPTAPGTAGTAKPKHAAPKCGISDLKVTPGHQAANRPEGTGVGAAVVGFANTSAHPCTVKGFVTVGGAGNGAPDHNVPLAATHVGTASTVLLAPGARAWTKLTFVQVQGEGDGYCVSGAKPSSYPSVVLGVPGAGHHQTAMDDGVFAECDDTVKVSALSATKPS
ncbi:hypothetical protein A8W25_14150 [Streptomyces sp. ERV7]|uniref:DUF4232 domain-containing protein n=1 Tax=Streptomyces sp. ERV7 TaxID=1322334 RepID=UPI0007F3DBC6|nr:DUF4232 domain-containing protein [Streptomyces sp. ERV7]OAR23666.1 hypothetical protein A8W25_14150 [Streptomyces sp. ERV7]